MATQPLTDRRLRGFVPPVSGRLVVSDGTVPGLQFRLTAAGVASWSIMVNVDGRKRRFTVGRYPDVGLADARRRAARLRVEALDGHDPIRARREAEAAARAAIPLSEVLDFYCTDHLRANLRSAYERERQLRGSLRKYLRNPVSALETAHLNHAIRVKARTAPVMANRLRAAFSHFARWMHEQAYIECNIADGLGRPNRETPRERVMSLDEIRSLWHASTAEDQLWGSLLRLLILTAQRRGDVAGMRWSEIDTAARRWTIAGARSKNRRPHVVHLSEPALIEIAAMQDRCDPDRDLVFTTTGERPVSGFGRLKARLDASSGLTDWRLHDIRTAFASALCDAGEPETVVDRVLNHVASGSAPSAVARVYNRADMLDQRAAALDRWAQMIMGGSAAVLEFPARTGVDQA